MFLQAIDVPLRSSREIKNDTVGLSLYRVLSFLYTILLLFPKLLGNLLYP